MSPLIIWAAAVFVGLSASDLSLTLKNLKLGAVENNPLLGKHPKPEIVTAFAVVTTALWVGIALWIYSKGVSVSWVAGLFAWGIALRLWVVNRNYKLYKRLKK